MLSNLWKWIIIIMSNVGVPLTQIIFDLREGNSIIISPSCSSVASNDDSSQLFASRLRKVACRLWADGLAKGLRARAEGHPPLWSSPASKQNCEEPFFWGTADAESLELWRGDKRVSVWFSYDSLLCCIQRLFSANPLTSKLNSSPHLE